MSPTAQMDVGLERTDKGSEGPCTSVPSARVFTVHPEASLQAEQCHSSPSAQRIKTEASASTAAHQRWPWDGLPALGAEPRTVLTSVQRTGKPNDRTVLHSLNPEAWEAKTDPWLWVKSQGYVVRPSHERELPDRYSALGSSLRPAV